MFQGRLKGVSQKIERCFKRPLSVIQGSFKVSKRISKVVSRQFQRCFEEDSRALKKVLSVFQDYFIKSFKGILKIFH